MPRGQRLEGFSNGQTVELAPTVTREGALGAAVSFIAEAGRRRILLTLSQCRQFFLMDGLLDDDDSVLAKDAERVTVQCLPPASETEKAKKETLRQQMKPPRSSGRPPKSGWNDVHLPPMYFDVEPALSKRSAAELKTGKALFFLLHTQGEVCIQMEEMNIEAEMRRQGADGDRIGFIKHKLRGGVELCEGATDVFVATLNPQTKRLKALLRQYK